MAGQNHDQADYNPEAIRQLLLAAFTAQDLRRFCLDRPLFRPIVDNFGPKYNLNDMVDEVLFYCQPRALFEPLLAEVRQVSPRQVARFEGRLHDPTYAGPAASALDRSPLPLRKLAQFVKQAIAGDTEAARALRNRQTMLQLVSNTWVKGYLERSLHGVAMIELGIEQRADALQRPWSLVMRALDERSEQSESGRRLPPGARIIDLFDDVSQSLLILGEPGSGKTTTLLELARDAVARAQADPSQPIPVVLKLSSWAHKRQPIAEWLAQELAGKYYFPKKIAQPWIDNDGLLLLLDGLDEVKADLRDACVQAINAFLAQHRVALAVCCRVADYEALSTRLNLHGEARIQPLTSGQIDDYLQGAGSELQAVRETLEHDPPLRELARTPLMLSVMALAYRGVSVEELDSLSSVEARKQHLFAAYVAHMFKRTDPHPSYPPRQAIHWLAWLAQEMKDHDQTLFLIEGLQPYWLPPPMRLPARLFVGMIFGLLFGLIGFLLFGKVSWLIGGLVGGLLMGLIIWPGSSIEPVEKIGWSWAKVWSRLTLAFVVGSLLFGLFGGLLFKLGGGLRGGLIVGLICGLGCVLVSGLVFGKLDTRAVPNQGIRQSARNAILLGLLFGLGGALLTGLYPVLRAGSTAGLVKQLLLGLFFGAFLGLLYGGIIPVVEHYALRFLLWRQGYLPWRCARFLDYADRLILLRKVGGGYTFVHPLFQDYFASLSPPQPGRA